MNRIIPPLLILIWSLAYTYYWHTEREPKCACEQDEIINTADSVIINSPAITDSLIADSLKSDTLQINTQEREILFTPLDVYFNAGKSSIDRTAEVDTFITTAKKFLEKYPEKTLLITGHSDSDGSETTNLILSENRAKKAKDILIQEGIPEAQMEIVAKGETEPIGDNTTAEGKSKNRRVTVKIKE